MNLTNNTRTFTKEEALNLRELNGKVAVSSLWIAEQANTRHSDLMEKVRVMFKDIGKENEVLIPKKEEDGKFRSPNSINNTFVNYYLSQQNKLIPFYIFPELEANFVIASFSNTYRYKLMQELHNYRENKYAKQLQDLESEKRIALMDLQMYEIKERVQKNHEKHVIDVVRKLNEDGLNYDPTTLATNLDLPSSLKLDTSLALSNIYKEVRANIRTYSATHLLEKYNINIRTKDFNNILEKLNILETYTYTNSLGTNIKLKKFVTSSNYFGYNQYASSINELPYKVVYYEDRFQELVEALQKEGYLLD